MVFYGRVNHGRENISEPRRCDNVGKIPLDSARLMAKISIYTTNWGGQSLRTCE